MSRRAEIFAALLALLQTVDPLVARDTGLGELSGGDVAALREGEVEQVAVFINAPGAIYEFVYRPALLLVRRGDPEGLDAALDDVVAALAAAGDLGGLVTAIRPQPPVMAPRELFGAAPIEAAELIIECDYWSAQSAG